ncbi:patatin-like phospholipase family protein [Legionella cardiaca]|uniref:Patatin-like phospholipase family protein n=1 Tax=Legionella cardiaca TaxID=1071983 RepID=A0ABY8AT92_9GAMM|nr:patatin-like phospholipase family protein [Legionella cardiaca]WED42999.1 patatin-like phospholipase family protein [Legionella cardiaca]
MSVTQRKETQQQFIERVVFSGGGAKGVGYGGSYKALEDTGVCKNVRVLAGASAGAIVAAFIAFGMPSAIFSEKLQKTNLKRLLGRRVSGKAPGVSYVTKDGKFLEVFIRENILATVKDRLKKIENTEETIGNAAEFVERRRVINELLTKIEGKNPRITFKDLATLNYHFPKYFKQLSIPAVRFPDGALQIFNSDLTPEVEIALACRASASIPLILEPVEIEINGIKKRFVDGGLYDNLPTDYFDSSNEVFTKNKKPEQTLVFAFSEGISEQKNHTFRALYGPRWDEVIADEVLDVIIDDAIKMVQKITKADADLNSAEDEVYLMTQAVKSILNKQVKNKDIGIDEAKAIMHAMRQSFELLLLKPQKNQEFWSVYKQEKIQRNRVRLLAAFVKEKMKPILYEAGAIEKFKRNVLVEMFGNLKTPYKNTIQKEVGYQKLRSDYALRTVEMRVGYLQTTDFKEATKLARVMDALGYLDTINYITNHELQDPDIFSAEQFYIDIVKNFEQIHHAILLGSGQDPKVDKLTQLMAALRLQLANQGKSEEIISRQLYQLIRDKVEQELDSSEAFSLSRAVEFHNQTLTAELLFKETYEEAFKRSGLFALSNIAGERIFKTSTLHEVLKKENMFTLYAKQISHHGTRSDKVFAALAKLPTFHQAYNKGDVIEDVLISATP